MKLTPGQRPRIGIARAFLKDAPIAIAHRLSTLRNFDRIVVMQAGGVCEDGPPQVLVQNKGVYCNLVRREVARLPKAAA